MRKNTKIIRIVKNKNACREGIEWLLAQKSVEAAYNNCERADWLLWLAGRIGVDRKIVVLAACDCAATSLKYVKKGEDRPKIAIKTARAWVKGKATIKEVRSAADAAAAAAYADAANAASDAAAYAADAYAADAAADAAAYAADAAAANAAADAAADAASASASADAANAASDAAAANAAAARKKALKRMANIVRKRISLKDFKKCLKN